MKTPKYKLGNLLLVIVVAIVMNACTSNGFVDRVPTGSESCPENPFPTVTRQGSGLSLSGGGYRATLFHLGALRRLNELGLLHRIDEISSVSGGSITAGQLGAAIQKKGGRLTNVLTPTEWDEHVAGPLHQLTQEDIRTWPILKRYLVPWNWPFSSTAINTVAETLEEDLTNVMVKDLPEKPDFVFNATELSFGANWEMRKWRMGSYRTGYLVPVPGDWSLGRAIAASAAFPPVLQPMIVDADITQFKGYFWDTHEDTIRTMDKPYVSTIDDHCWKTGSWEKGMKDLRLSDGGVYDNLGLEPIWKDREYLFVSDGGMTLDAHADEGFTSRLARWTGIMSEQAAAVRKRMLILLEKVLEEGNTPAKSVYWSLSQGSEDPPGYSKDLAANFLSYIRTDLDGFNEVERKVLENHGYFVADQAIRKQSKHLQGLIDLNSWPALQAPHPEWTRSSISECTIKKALVNGYDKC